MKLEIHPYGLTSLHTDKFGNWKFANGYHLLKYAIFIFVFFIPFFSLKAEVISDSLILKANKEYSEGLYNNAIENYLNLVDEGFESPKLYYNLGNAYFKINEMAPAILYYEKAKKLDPNDVDIDYNLNIARNKIPDKIESVPVLFYIRWWNSIYSLLSTNALAIVCMTAFFITLVLLAIYFLSNVYFYRKLSFWFGILFFVFSITSFVLSYQKYNSFSSKQEAIVFTPTITIKSSPNQNSVDLFVMHEGSKVRIIQHLGEWYEIRIANGSIGWLKASDVRTI